MLKNSSAVRLRAGQSLRIGEPVSLVIIDGALTKMTRGDCHELKQGSRYLLCLFKSDNPIFEIYNENLGRFDLDGKDPNNDVSVHAYATGQSPKRLMQNQLLARFPLTASPP